MISGQICCLKIFDTAAKYHDSTVSLLRNTLITNHYRPLRLLKQARPRVCPSLRRKFPLCHPSDSRFTVCPQYFFPIQMLVAQHSVYCFCLGMVFAVVVLAIVPQKNALLFGEATGRFIIFSISISYGLRC